MGCLEYNDLRFDLNITEDCSKGQLVSTGSGNGLAPNRRQAISWTDIDQYAWHVWR